MRAFEFKQKKKKIEFDRLPIKPTGYQSNRPVNRSNRPVYRYEPVVLRNLNSAGTDRFPAKPDRYTGTGPHRFGRTGGQVKPWVAGAYPMCPGGHNEPPTAAHVLSKQDHHPYKHLRPRSGAASRDRSHPYCVCLLALPLSSLGLKLFISLCRGTHTHAVHNTNSLSDHINLLGFSAGHAKAPHTHLADAAASGICSPRQGRWPSINLLAESELARRINLCRSIQIADCI